jgi:hypothetical protein
MNFSPKQKNITIQSSGLLCVCCSKFGMKTIELGEIDNVAQLHVELHLACSPYFEGHAVE